ncbi:hypothetical protein BURMUCF1_B0298, partial [Burkholderia multivorans ATCC BAA-247]
MEHARHTRALFAMTSCAAAQRCADALDRTC